MLSRSLELLSPAKTATIGREAISHGADAVYIGGPAFGARDKAGNAIGDIAALVEFAHRYYARIYVTLNTILHDTELEDARRLAYECYDAGVDALIVQDMGLLELDLPPIALHASTQCDIRTPEKASFLADAGFSQIVLARELTLGEIAKVRAAVPADTVLEHFIHGALCVAYSGQCYLSHAHTGRSANRGDCSQPCRLPYTLHDSQGRVVAFEKHLLSLKDNNQSANLRALVDAGVRSFKIEGRYKDASYVKNITGHYRQLLDAILEERPELARASSGRTRLLFAPNPDKTFQRGATDYFSHGRKPDIGAPDTPAFVGVPLGQVSKIGPDWFEIETAEAMANGDGLNYLYKRETRGSRANIVQRQGGAWRVWPNDKMYLLSGLHVGLKINRNSDQAWEQALAKESAERKIGIRAVFAETSATRSPLPNPLDETTSHSTRLQTTAAKSLVIPHAGEGAIEPLRELDVIDGFSLTLHDEDGIAATASAVFEKQPAKDPGEAENILREQLDRFGNTSFELDALSINWTRPWFVPGSLLNKLRRDAVAQLEAARASACARPSRKAAAEPPAQYPEASLTYLANVYNKAARAFYEKRGVKLIEAAYEARENAGDVPLM
ncbi:MAG: U32 family peptidase, partial [Gallionella sp.]|nr:U32 family peptidase [Gallionella sp.]